MATSPANLNGSFTERIRSLRPLVAVAKSRWELEVQGDADDASRLEKAEKSIEPLRPELEALCEAAIQEPVAGTLASTFATINVQTRLGIFDNLPTSTARAQSSAGDILSDVNDRTEQQHAHQSHRRPPHVPIHLGMFMAPMHVDTKMRVFPEEHPRTTTHAVVGNVKDQIDQLRSSTSQAKRSHGPTSRQPSITPDVMKRVEVLEQSMKSLHEDVSEMRGDISEMRADINEMLALMRGMARVNNAAPRSN